MDSNIISFHKRTLRLISKKKQGLVYSELLRLSSNSSTSLKLLITNKAQFPMASYTQNDIPYVYVYIHLL